MATQQIDYLKKAQLLKNSGFWVAGFGNFDITIKELALILECVENNDFDSIEKLYKRLAEERL